MDIAIILPHRIQDRNNDALQVALDCLVRNTNHDFRLLMDAAVNQPLGHRINRLVQDAPTECVVLMNSDMFVAPNWIDPMLALFDDRSFVTNIVIEPGAIGIWHLNQQMDFGRKPETFRRQEFEEWVKTQPARDGEGWYVPVMFPKSGWLEMEGLDLSNGEFPDRPLDVDLFEKWKSTGHRVVRAHSFVYHLQRWSDPEEQTHEKRNL